LYDSSWDCFKKVIRNEGVRGLYRGIGPQLIGVGMCFVLEATSLFAFSFYLMPF
jgi:hypothetical protein